MTSSSIRVICIFLIRHILIRKVFVDSKHFRAFTYTGNLLLDQISFDGMYRENDTSVLVRRSYRAEVIFIKLNRKMENSLVRVKHEPPVEFVLILPRPTHDWPAIKQEDVKLKWVESAQLTKFDAKRPSDSELFQTFLICQHCHLVMKHQCNLTRHLKTCSKLNPKGFECDICGESVQAKSRMRKHMPKHSSEKKFRCTKCGFKFKRNWLIIRRHTTNRLHAPRAKRSLLIKVAWRSIKCSTSTEFTQRNQSKLSTVTIVTKRSRIRTTYDSIKEAFTMRMLSSAQFVARPSIL